MVYRNLLSLAFLSLLPFGANAGFELDCNLHELVRGKKETVEQINQNFGCLQAMLENFSIEKDIQGTPDSTPAGLVAFFLQTSCPQGWSELEAANGRYLVAMPKNGSIGESVGTSLSNAENRAVGMHSHGTTDPEGNHAHDLGSAGEHSHGYTSTDNGDLLDNTENFLAGRSGSIGRFGYVDTKTTTAASAYSDSVGEAGSHTHVIDEAGDFSGTNAPYIQLLACVKSPAQLKN